MIFDQIFTLLALLSCNSLSEIATMRVTFVFMEQTNFVNVFRLFVAKISQENQDLEEFFTVENNNNNKQINNFLSSCL